jgi:hypothetical protein
MTNTNDIGEPDGRTRWRSWSCIYFDHVVRGDYNSLFWAPTLRTGSGHASHALAWLLQLWISSGNDALEATRDSGWFHEAAHLLAFGRDDAEFWHLGDGWRGVISMVRNAEQKVPGYAPPHHAAVLRSPSVRDRWW